MIDELERMAKLWKAGALTDAEFQSQKQRLFAIADSQAAALVAARPAPMAAVAAEPDATEIDDFAGPETVVEIAAEPTAEASVEAPEPAPAPGPAPDEPAEPDHPMPADLAAILDAPEPEPVAADPEPVAVEQPASLPDDASDEPAPADGPTASAPAAGGEGETEAAPAPAGTSLPKWAIAAAVGFILASGGIGFAVNGGIGGGSEEAHAAAPAEHAPAEHGEEKAAAPAAEPASLLQQSLELGVATRTTLRDYRDAGGLTSDASWHGLSLREVETQYDASGKLSYFSAVAGAGESPNSIKTAVSAYCGFKPTDWTRQDMGDLTSGKAKNGKCDASYLPFDETYWHLTVGLPGAAQPAGQPTHSTEHEPSSEAHEESADAGHGDHSARAEHGG